MSKATLNLDEELERSDITYKGATYELRNSSELSIVEAHNLKSILTTLDEVDASKDEESAARSGELLHSVAALLVVDPPSEGFPDQLCAAILSFWTDQNQGPEADPPTPPRRAPRDRHPKKKNQSTGVK